jgi:hypothetical protein
MGLPPKQVRAGTPGQTILPIDVAPNQWQSTNIFHVEQFGAKGDGTTDDTIAIQATIDATVSAGGGICRLRPVTYICKGVEVKPYIILWGCGFRTSLKAPWGGMNAGDHVVLLSGGNGLGHNGLRDLAVDGDRQGGNPVNGYGVKVLGCYRSMIDNVRVTNCGETGLFMHQDAGANQTKEAILRALVTDNSKDNIFINWGCYDVQGALIRSGSALNNGITISGGAGTRLSDVDIWSSGAVGMQLYAVGKIHMTQIRIEGATGIGLQISAGCNDVRLENLMIYDCGNNTQPGIYISDAATRVFLSGFTGQMQNNTQSYGLYEETNCVLTNCHWDIQYGANIIADYKLKAGQYTRRHTVSGRPGIIVAGPPLTNLVSWLQADTLIGAHGSAIVTCTDQSGAGNDFVQGTGAFQPLFYRDVLNGHHAIWFDGANDCLTCDGLAATFSGDDKPLSIMAVAWSTPTWANQGALLGLGSSASAIPRHAFTAHVDPALRLFRRDDASNWAELKVVPPLGTDWEIWTSIFSGAAAENRVSGKSNTGAVDVGVLTANQLTLGGFRQVVFDSPFNGYIVEVLIWSKALSTAERLQAEFYLSEKYGIPLKT